MYLLHEHNIFQTYLIFLCVKNSIYYFFSLTIVVIKVKNGSYYSKIVWQLRAGCCG